jgi:uncharacterized protein (UPF0218 family)
MGPFIGYNVREVFMLHEGQVGMTCGDCVHYEDDKCFSLPPKIVVVEDKIRHVRPQVAKSNPACMDFMEVPTPDEEKEEPCWEVHSSRITISEAGNIVVDGEEMLPQK